MNRRYFFRQLASGLVAASAPGLFLPKLIKPGWKVARLSEREVIERAYEIRKQRILLDILEKLQAGFKPLVRVDGMGMSAASWFAFAGRLPPISK